MCPTAPPMTIEIPRSQVQNAGMAKKTVKEVNAAMDMPEYKPRLTVNVKQLPDIKDWEVGKTYTLEIKGKMISKSQGGWDGSQPLEATFEVAGAKTDDETEENETTEGDADYDD